MTTQRHIFNAAVAAIWCFTAACAPNPSAPTESNSRDGQESSGLPPLLWIQGTEKVYYPVPATIINRLQSTIKKENSYTPSSDTAGNCRNFGIVVYLKGKQMKWYGNIVLVDGNFYRDPTDLLKEYDQYLMFIGDYRGDGSYSWRLAELDQIVGDNGLLKEDKLEPAQRRMVLEARANDRAKKKSSE